MLTAHNRFTTRKKFASGFSQTLCTQLQILVGEIIGHQLPAGRVSYTNHQITDEKKALL
jgi:hypothetical protein